MADVRYETIMCERRRDMILSFSVCVCVYLSLLTLHYRRWTRRIAHTCMCTRCARACVDPRSSVRTRYFRLKLLSVTLATKMRGANAKWQVIYLIKIVISRSWVLKKLQNSFKTLKHSICHNKIVCSQEIREDYILIVNTQGTCGFFFEGIACSFYLFF